MRSLTALLGEGPERWWWLAALAFLATFLILAVVQRFDLRVLAGDSVWAKPMKFSIATAIHFGTVALVIRYLSDAIGGGGAMRWVAAISIAAAVFEVAYIALQGGRGQPSHFNTSKPVYAALWGLMAFAALLVLMPFAVLGIIAAIDSGSAFSPTIRIGVAIGLVASAILTTWAGFSIGANMGHFVGPPPATDIRVPLFGWSLHGADLRPAHFSALHIAQAIPLAAVIFNALLPSRLASGATIVTASIWIAITCWMLRAALNGQSLRRVLS